MCIRDSHIHRPMTEALAKILVADDEPDLRALLQRYLSDQGYSCLLYTSRCV